ncbi:TPA: hypothetical protein DIV45_01775 [Patescibacteria group bacterium]|uniref:Uncharacterized protein n=1 Tax=candidate division Kazan bacterium GW2011_GWB1_45_10 TaxID=1620411 RepID=A0A0G1N2J3_UNCK3|nr:MAG: hypothetical protein UV88_C0013G0010 [Parcubacteria group bacterium GW2011_GWA1_43_21]KKT87287.1 MAG: hypothetical protein VE97_C0001G0002 [candidate division Kazan bacterium GW2011_GWB1_45_10]HCR42074.1 hypothetical protein [Patescibacteria group bacterium]
MTTNTYMELDQQADALLGDINQNGQKVLAVSLKTQLLLQHRQAVAQALAELKKGTNPGIVWQTFNTKIDQLKGWIKQQNAGAMEALEEELARLSTDQAYN